MTYDESRPPRTDYEKPEGWERGIADNKAVSYGVEQRVYAVLYLSGGQITDDKGYASGRIQRLMSGPKRSRETVIRACNQLEAKGWVIIDKRGNARKTYGVYLMDGERKPAKWALEELRTQIIERKSKAAAKKAEAPADYQAKSPAIREIEKQNEAIRAQRAADEAALADAVADVGVATEAAVVTVEEPAPLDAPAEITEAASETVFRSIVQEADPAEIADALFLRFMDVISKGPQVQVVEKTIEKQDSETMTAIKKERSELRQRVKAMEAELKGAKDYAYNVENELSASRAQIAQMDKNIDALVTQVKTLTDRIEVAKARERREKEKRPRQPQGQMPKPVSERGNRLRDMLSPEDRAVLDNLQVNPNEKK